MKQEFKYISLLRYIDAMPNGASFSDCQRFICTMNGLDFDEMRKERVWDGKEVVLRMRRRYRGYWTDALLGGWPYYNRAILRNYCTKGEGRRGRYTLNEAGKELIK